jgi:HAD superfamily hydrolase (TIGR01484 family)
MLSLNQWPLADRRGIAGVFTDIDDTLTTEGAITPAALQALHDLRAAGLVVIPITGRPIGWCTPFMDGGAGQAWPVDTMVAENGAVAYARTSSSPISSQIGLQPACNKRDALSKLYQLDRTRRAANTAAMQQVAQRVLREVPGVGLSHDSVGRETDLAFDYAEHARLSPDTVQQVLAVLQDSGMQTTVSSIHIHGCFGHFDKWTGAQWIVRTLWGRDLAAELAHWVFVGDSGNDQAMFANFPHSVGVANICRYADQLQHLPRYITPSERGQGFAEVAQAILQARLPPSL